jgi:hypothetical protein
MHKFNVGDKVVFDMEFLMKFIEETTTDNESLLQYQKLILAGANQIGVVKKLDEPLTIVSYPDGWDLPIPTKYLIIVP